MAAYMPIADTWRLSTSRTAGEAGFDALFVTHYEAVYRLLYRIAGTREEAEDLTQETFLRLHRERRLWAAPPGEGQNVRGWLLRVATNLALNTLRGRARRQRREERVSYEDALMSSRAPDPADAAVRADERDRVRRVLAHLPERQAQLLLMRHAGLSYRELAQALNMAPGSVGATLARAEAAFEAAFRGGEIADEGGKDAL